MMCCGSVLKSLFWKTEHLYLLGCGKNRKKPDTKYIQLIRTGKFIKNKN